MSFTDDFDKEIPADVKAEQKKTDDKYTHTDKKILYWQQLGIILDNLSEQLNNSSDKRKGPNHAQISLKEHENKSSLSQLKTNGFSIASPPFEGVQVKINPYLRKVGEKKARTQKNDVCVRAINFKVFLDREKLQLKHPRFLRGLSKNQRFKLDSNLTQTNELSKNQSSSVSIEKTNSAQNSKDLTTSDLLITDLKNSTEYGISDTLPKVSIGIEGIASTPDTEIPKVSGTDDTKSLEVISSKIQEYLNKECHGSAITQSIDTHVNDFRKLYPEFKKESRLHLEYAFRKVLKSAPPLDKSQQKEDTLQKPVVEKKGIAILKKALHGGKVEATL